MIMGVAVGMFSTLLRFFRGTCLLVRLLVGLVVACCGQTSAASSFYRATWLDPRVAIASPGIVSFHRDSAESVARAHRFCSDKSSNVAAFAICLHRAGGSILASAQLPYVVSSGDQKSGGTSGVSTVLVKEMFLKSYDGLSPLQAEINFVDFIAAKNSWGELSEIKSALEARLLRSGVLDIPDLTFSSNPSEQQKDQLLGSILHCEQAVLVKSMLSDQFLSNWISNLKPVNFGSPNDVDFLSLDIITYNDMCPKCFFTCFNCRRELEVRINEALKKFCKWPASQSTIPLRVFVSSFRPYAVGSGEEHTRVCQTCTRKQKPCSKYCEFHAHTPSAYRVSDFSAEILQFFNPWMASYVVGFEIVDFVDSALASKIVVGDARGLDCSKLLECLQIAGNGSISTLGLIQVAQDKVREYKTKLGEIKRKIEEELRQLP